MTVLEVKISQGCLQKGGSNRHYETSYQKAVD